MPQTIHQTTHQTTHSFVEEVARLGDAWYENTVRPAVEPNHTGRIAAIDVLTGAYALGDTALAAARGLRQAQPAAEVWLVRVGNRTLHRWGRQPKEKPK